MTGLSLTVFGGLAAMLDEQPLQRLPTVRAQGLLAYLAVESALGGAVQRREALMELLWPGMPPASSRKNLRTTLYYLRRSIGDYSPGRAGQGESIPFLLSDRDTVQTNPAFPLHLDLATFLRLLDGPRGGWPEAVNLYQGDFLAGFTIPDANPFEEWAGARRAAFRRQALQALNGLTREALTAPDLPMAEQYARRQLDLDQLREPAWRQLIQALALAGRRSEALAEYESCVQLLWTELRLEPSAETQDLYREILEGSLPAVDDLAGNKSTIRPPHNLPAQTSPFIGRHEQIAEVLSLLRATRLVTLTGPGGTGKTRLGLQVAAAAVDAAAGDYPDGIIFVGLASTADSQLVANAIASELGVLEQPGQSLVQSLGRYFGPKKALLLLDNYEHVLDAAPLVTDLLAAAPGLTVLATSREVLNLSGEREYSVPPLTVPELKQSESVEQLSSYESVALFEQRAQAAQPGFRLTGENAQTVASICAHLDGLPLAIELAAARIRILGPSQMLDRLESRLGLLKGGARDLPARQRTLRDTIEWSYNLLDENEQRLFARLSVFSGGRSLEAVEAVCGPGLAIDPLDGLESLINKSLLFQEVGAGAESRFYMLETIQEYAGQRLIESSEERQLRDRHLIYFMSLAEEMEPGYRRHGQLRLLERTEAELDNFRAALDWAMESGQIEAGARLVSALDYYLYYKDRYVEGYRWFNRLLRELDRMALKVRVRFLIAAARLAWVNGDLTSGIQFCQKGLGLAREIGDRRSEAWLLENLTACLVESPEHYEEAKAYGEQALTMFRQLDEKPGLAQTLNILGELARLAGDYERAKELYEECLPIVGETGEILRQAMILANLAFVAYEEGDFERASRLIRLSLEPTREIGARQMTISGLGELAGPLAGLGEPVKAARLLGAAQALMTEMAFDYHPSDLSEMAKYAAAARAQLDDAAFEAAWAEGQAMSLEQALTYALSDD